MSSEAIAVVFFDLGDTLGIAVVSTDRHLVGFHPFGFTAPVLRSLRGSRGLRLGVISNTGDDPGSIVSPVLASAGILDLLDHDLLVYSKDVGKRKDSPEIFTDCARLAGFSGTPGRCLYVGEDARERDFAAQAGMAVCPHPLLVGEVLDGESLRYIRLTVPPERLGEPWRAPLREKAIVPLRVTGPQGGVVYAITSQRTIPALMDLRFVVDVLGVPDAPRFTELYLLRDDEAIESGFLASAGQATRFFAKGEDAELVVGSTVEGVLVALPAKKSVGDLHFSKARHGHNLKLILDSSLLADPVTVPPSFAPGQFLPPTLSDAEVEELGKITGSVILDRVERLSGVKAAAPGAEPIKSRHIRHDDNQRAVDAVAAELQAIGGGRLEVRLHPFTHEGRSLYNIEAELKGSSPALTLVTAHLDSTAAFSPPYHPAADIAPGADDDASGVAAVLSIAERLVQLSASGAPALTTRFVLFNAEEEGLVGSKVYARFQRLVLNADIRAVFQMDMIGYNREPPQSWEVHAGYISSAEVQNRSLDLAARLSSLTARVAAGLDRPQIYPNTATEEADPADGRSDHSPFQERNYPACVVSEDFFAGPHPSSPQPEGNPEYHRKTDTFINPQYAAMIARVVGAAAWTMVRASGSPNAFDEEHAMPSDVTVNAQFTKDSNGKVRQIRHLRQPFTASDAGMAPLTPRQLADRYVREVAGTLDLSDGMLNNFAAPIARAPAGTGQDLRFTEEKTVAGSTTVSYAQTVYSLPIWQSGLTVRMRSEPLAVTGAQNELHYRVDVEQLPSDAKYVPDRLSEEVLQKLLPLPAKGRGPTITGKRLLIYQYDPTERTDPEATVNAARNSSFESGPPTLTLPPVPNAIQTGKYYVVSEVLFNVALPGRRPLNWRVFIEPQTGSILYLRALVACARAMVFRTDPVTETGRPYTGSSPAIDLDSTRATVNLFGLTPPGNGTLPQGLQGQYVKLVDRQLPTSEAPQERSPFDFFYSAPTASFAAANAYHHCDGLFRLVEHMGIDVRNYFDGTRFPVTVDHYGMDGEVNAEAPGNALGNGSDGFNFGIVSEGHSLGIACDHRVVLHEFGHVLLWDHVRSPTFGFAHSAGDSLAAILHDPDSLAPDPGDSFPFMTASADIDRRHDRRVEDGWAWGGIRDNRGYGSEQILSTTLFRVYKAAGGASLDPTIRRSASRYVAFLVIKAIGTLTFTTRNPEVFTDALMDADVSTNYFEGWVGGMLYKVFRWSFEKQGLYQSASSPPPITHAGQPPASDVFIDNSRNGEYGPYLDSFDNERGVWNRRARDGQDGHQSPVPGTENYLYVRVRNRGTGLATNVTLLAFRSSSPSDHTWPGSFTPVNSAPTPVPNIPAGGTAFVGPIPWTPSAVDHYVLVSVSADNDPSNTEVVQHPAPCSLLVQLDNNLAMRML